MEASLVVLNRDYVTAIQKITALQTSCETAVAKSKQLENDLKDYETSAATLTEHQNKKNTTLTAQVSTLENEKEALEQNTRSLEDELIEVRDKYENAQETTINLKSHSEGATNTALELQRVHQQLKKI
uniref:TACC_C domain-containing protein n=1 Tax=Strongyloides papillosus TaxID=174720 RepID=A0A0N5BCN9_STREA